MGLGAWINFVYLSFIFLGMLLRAQTPRRSVKRDPLIFPKNEPASKLFQRESVMTDVSKFGWVFLRIVGCAIVGVLIGLVLLYVIVVDTMKFDSWLVDALIVGAIAFGIFAVLRGPLSKPWWVAPIFSATPVLTLAFAGWITSGPEWMFSGLFAMVLLSGLGGAFVGTRWRSS